MPYTLTWLTSQLAVGSAPMSYEDLDVITAQGVNAIVNLCAEFCDLHQIEEQSGFEVYYLPVPDECAPDMELLEEALNWLDEALYLKKKVLIHCRHGLGRTGTFVSAYLLRRGLGLKLTEKRLKSDRVSPGSYSQWQLLRKYGKQQGELSARPPSIEDKETIDLLPFLREYGTFIEEADALALAAGINPLTLDSEICCHQYFEMELIEAVHISHTMNKQLSREQRLAAMERASLASCLLKKTQAIEGDAPREVASRHDTSQPLACPLLVENTCILHAKRPLRCRLGLDLAARNRLNEAIGKSSRTLFLALTGAFPPTTNLRFSNFDTVSGRFVQQYFQAMINNSQS
jgi:protein-tyrosine phosphatase